MKQHTERCGKLKEKYNSEGLNTVYCQDAIYGALCSYRNVDQLMVLMFHWTGI